MKKRINHTYASLLNAPECSVFLVFLSAEHYFFIYLDKNGMICYK